MHKLFALFVLCAWSWLEEADATTPNDSSCEKDIKLLSDKLSQLSRQVMADTLAREERVRSDGDSGLKITRLNRYGSRPYFHSSFAANSFAAMHDHANNIRTVGMGEVIAVLNGVEFRTRHNDYRLNMPSTTSADYHKVENIPFPDVPPSVESKSNLTEQITEMQEYFRAWATQNASHRNYKDYFKPILCYLEGAWTKKKGAIDEPFFSDRHFINAKSWFDLLEKIQKTSYTGTKDNGENLAYLPTKLMYLDGDTPVFGQWNYRILCHPLSKDVPLKYLQPVDDMQTRTTGYKTLQQHTATRGARFVVRGREGRGPYHRGLIDDLMEEIPGKNNYIANFTDTSDLLQIEVRSNKAKNVGYYNRVFRVNKKGAMGTSVIQRGFNDANLFVAINNQSQIVPVVVNKCKGKWKKKTCWKEYIRASYAIPLEIIYMTPLSKWNPLNIEFKGHPKSEEGKTVYSNPKGRNGRLTLDLAYNGTNTKTYYITPSEFYESGRKKVDPADTTRNRVGVLNCNGDLVATRASGTRIFLQPIADLGSLRQRWPIAPIHEEGSSTNKELQALKDDLKKKEKMMDAKYDFIIQILREGNDNKLSFNTTDPTAQRNIDVQTGPSVSKLVDIHRHTITLTPDDLHKLRVLKQTVSKLTTRDNGHEHFVTLKARGRKNFEMVACDNEPACWDRHKKYIKGQ